MVNGATGVGVSIREVLTRLGALLDPAPSHTELTFVTNDGPTFAGDAFACFRYSTPPASRASNQSCHFVVQP